MLQKLTDNLVNIGLGDSLVPSGNKPLTKSMLMEVYDSIWHH